MEGGSPPMARGRLDRTLRLDPAPANHPAQVAEIQFRDEWGKIVQSFSPALFGMPDDISAAIARAFRDHDVASSAATRTAHWSALRVFGRFLRDDPRVRRQADRAEESRDGKASVRTRISRWPRFH